MEVEHMTKAQLLEALKDVPDDQHIYVVIKNPVYWPDREPRHIIPTYALRQVEIERDDNEKPCITWLITGRDIDDGCS